MITFRAVLHLMWTTYKLLIQKSLYEWMNEWVFWCVNKFSFLYRLKLIWKKDYALLHNWNWPTWPVLCLPKMLLLNTNSPVSCSYVYKIYSYLNWYDHSTYRYNPARSCVCLYVLVFMLFSCPFCPQWSRNKFRREPSPTGSMPSCLRWGSEFKSS